MTATLIRHAVSPNQMVCAKHRPPHTYGQWSAAKQLYGELRSGLLAGWHADEVRKDRAKAIKNDATHRLAILLDSEGEVGVAKKWEGEPEFHAAWKAKSRDLLAKAAFRRQKLTLRLKVNPLFPFPPIYTPMTSFVLPPHVYHSNPAVTLYLEPSLLRRTMLQH